MLSYVFFIREINLIFCNNIKEKMGFSEYILDNWRLFIDSPQCSPKCVPLLNGNKYGLILIAYSTTMKEEYKRITLGLQKIKYGKHQWAIYVDLKMVNFLLGHQSGYSEYPCF